MKKINKNLLIGIGTATMIAAPTFAVISCKETKTTQSTGDNSGTSTAHNTPSTPSYITSFNGGELYRAITPTKFKNFIKLLYTNPDESNMTTILSHFVMSNSINSEDSIMQAAEHANITDRHALDMIREVISKNAHTIDGNSVRLAVGVLAFTCITMEHITMSLMGVASPTLSSASSNPSFDINNPPSTLSASDLIILNRVKEEISGGSVDFHTITEGIMSKFSGQDSMIWGQPGGLSLVYQLYSVPRANVLQEGTMVSMNVTMGGTNIIRDIVTAAGITYIPAS